MPRTECGLCLFICGLRNNSELCICVPVWVVYVMCVVNTCGLYVCELCVILCVVCLFYVCCDHVSVTCLCVVLYFMCCELYRIRAVVQHSGDDQAVRLLFVVSTTSALTRSRFVERRDRRFRFRWRRCTDEVQESQRLVQEGDAATPGAREGCQQVARCGREGRRANAEFVELKVDFGMIKSAVRWILERYPACLCFDFVCVVLSFSGYSPDDLGVSGSLCVQQQRITPPVAQPMALLNPHVLTVLIPLFARSTALRQRTSSCTTTHRPCAIEFLLDNPHCAAA